MQGTSSTVESSRTGVECMPCDNQAHLAYDADIIKVIAYPFQMVDAIVCATSMFYLFTTALKVICDIYMSLFISNHFSFCSCSMCTIIVLRVLFV